jgi:signal transduction histidine kinase
MNKVIQAVWSSMLNNTENARPYLSILGVILLVAFLAFYFLNLLFFIPEANENFFLRILITACGFFLIYRQYCPRFMLAIFPLIFYFILLFSFPFFFSFMLFSNPDSSIWQINGLVGFVLLSFFLDWISFVFLSCIGVLLAYYAVPGGVIIDQHLIAVFGSYSAPIIYFIIFSSKRNQMQEEREEFNLRIKLLNEELEEKIRERTIDLEKALAIKTDFLNNISHEIRAPIQGFAVISEGLVEYWKEFSEEKRYECAVVIANNATRILDLILNLLDMSKFQAGKMILDLKCICFSDLVEIIIEECRDLYLNKKLIKIEFIKGEEVFVNADRNRMLQVLRNLFYNAIKFSPNYSVIKVNVSEKDNNLHFIISDEGIGLDKEEFNKIFEPFEQGGRSNKYYGGTGLGLSISKEIVNAHGGKIWAENNFDIGASFHFTLPVYKKLSE